MLSVDPQRQIVTVQPGITWEQLDHLLKEHDLTLRLYPTSYPSSTVGGWLAQGGAGVGSFEFGYFRDSVIAARIVLPSGEVRELGGADLDLVSDVEGLTGLISQVTLSVQPLAALQVAALSVLDAHKFQALLQSLIAARLPLWSVVFISPKMAELKNQAPVREHNGHLAEEHVQLPHADIVTLAFRAADALAVQTALPQLAAAHGAQILSDTIARHEWAQRFKLMTIKRLGPSLVPAEVIVPLAGLANTVDEFTRKVGQPLVKEGVLLRQGAGGAPEVVILGFIPADQRKFSYNFVFGLALTILKIAERHGGRPYATGIYFTGKVGQVLGRDRVGRLRAFKAAVDPAGILNPGKVLNGGLIGAALRVANWFEPLIRRFGNAVTTEIGERASHAGARHPGRYRMVRLRLLDSAATVSTSATSSTAAAGRARVRAANGSGCASTWRAAPSGISTWLTPSCPAPRASCATCVARPLCRSSQSWMKLRGQLIQEQRRMTFPPFEMMSAALVDQGNIWAGYRKNRSAWFPDELKAKHGPEHKSKAVYFAGCTASYVENDIAIGTVRLLDAAGVDFTYLGERESCCATPMLVAGRWDLFAETMKKNIQAVKDAGADTVISSCPACDMMWRQVYPAWAKKLGIDYPITARHYSEIVAEKIASGEFAFPANSMVPATVTWHDSCRYRAGFGCLRATARRDQGDPEHHLGRDALQPRVRALLRIGADADQGAADRARYRQDTPGRGDRGWCREGTGTLPMLRVPAAGQRRKEAGSGRGR